METVILRPFSSDMDGIVEYSTYGGRVKLKYSLKRRDTSDNRIYKLMLFSSIKPSNVPIIADTPEFKGETAFGSRTIDNGTLSINGYSAEDIDTFALTLKENGRFDIASVGFGRLSWEVMSASVTDDAPYDPALKRAYDLLDSQKESVDFDTYQSVIFKLNSLKKTLKKSFLNPLGSYEWYELSQSRVPLNISSFEHLLTDEVFKNTIENGTSLLMGIGDDGAVAFCAADTDTNPFENALDCTVRRGRFWLVGVRLKDDGQYFERL